MNKVVLIVIVLFHALCVKLGAQCNGMGTMTDGRDGNVYNIIQIDGNTAPYCAGSSQCWMQENLNHGTRINGPNNQTNNGTIEKYCQGDTEANCTIYGGLYQWDEMMNYNTSDKGNPGTTQGICPAGWHIPTDDEWKCLEMNLGMSQAQVDLTNYRGTTEGDQLKVTAGHTPAWDGTNTSNFFALPNGFRNWAFAGSGYFALGTGGWFWSATERDAGNAWTRVLDADPRITRFAANKPTGTGVRCIGDVAPIPLPVQLLYFKASWLNGSNEVVSLNWETESETNNSHFEIERSVDGVYFEYVKSVNGQGNSNTRSQYVTLDEEPYTRGTSYYRLKQVDNDGSFQYSNIEVLNVTEGLNMINLFPNPATIDLTVLLTSSVDTEVNIDIKNNLGQQIRGVTKNLSQGLTTLNVDVTDLASGNYIIKIVTTGGQYKTEGKFIRGK